MITKIKGDVAYMIIGKWNKSVILTYIGLLISIFGIYTCFCNENGINIAMSCLITAGICDLFDGVIARKCKRNNEEKNFGIQLDSLVDAINFIAFPIIIFLKMELNLWYNIIAFGIFSICGIARLAYFNITIENNDTPIKYYKGLPVTYSAMIFPISYLLKNIMILDTFKKTYTLIILIVSILNILNIKIAKPKGIAYILFSILAIVMLILYLGVL